MRLWANVWDVFRRTPSRVGGGRRAAVDFVVCFGCGGTYFVFFFLVFFSSKVRPVASMTTPCLIHLSSSNRVTTAGHYLISISVCICVTFVDFYEAFCCL